MARLLATSAVLAAVAWGAAALADPPLQRPPARVFLSPSGEPFRRSADMPDPLAAWFAQADTGRLGYLDRAEFRADATRFFHRLDENGDGIVDGFEVQDYESKVVPELADWSEGIPVSDMGSGRHDHDGGPGGHGDGHGRRDHGHQPPGGDHQRNSRAPAIAQLIAEPEPVTAADFNFDSHITLDEWMRATDARFAVLDKDHTGKLTLDELRARMSPQATHTRHEAAPPPAQTRLD